MNSMRLETCTLMCNEMLTTVGQAIGIHVLLLVIEHSLWLAGQQYKEAALIRFSEQGVFLDRLNDIEPEKAIAVAYEFITAIMATLGKLMGKQLAKQFTEELQIERIQLK
ncbi:MAG TPA: hypothetical protein VF531_14390 [Bacillota bacterium]